MLTDDSRLQAHLAADPAMKPRRDARPEKWREHWGWGKDRHMVAEVWEAIVGVAPRKPNTAAPKYPRPGTEAKKAGIPLSQLIPPRTPSP